MILGLGVDLCEIARFERALSRHGDRLERRVFTEAERAYCRAHGRAADHFAARFAAKEAALKALGVPPGLSWHELEVTSAPGLPPRLILRGAAARAATTGGVASMHLSISHDGGHAVAMVVAEGAAATS